MSEEELKKWAERVLYQRYELEEENKRLQEQLNEANEVIKRYKRFETALKIEKGVLVGVYPAWDYLKKWCVK